MENNPRKSRALKITIIAIVVLLVAVYFIFKNGGSLFGIKPASDSIFAPLLGTSKQKPIENIDNSNTDGNGGSGSGQGEGDGSGDQGGDFGNGDNPNNNTGGGTTGGGLSTNTRPAPLFSPIPTPGDGNTGGGSDNPPTGGGEIIISPPPIKQGEDPKICPIEQTGGGLEYTDAEKNELAELLRQYYLIAPELKSAQEVALLNGDIVRNQDLIDRADVLTGQCIQQKADPKYVGHKEIKNNPYYVDLSRAPDFYSPTIYHDLEFLLNIW